MSCILCLNRIAPVQLSDSGIYTCVASSRAGSADLNFDLHVQGTADLFNWLIYVNMNQLTNNIWK